MPPTTGTAPSFAILGPLLVHRDKAPVAIGAERERLLLATLLLRAGQVVDADELIDRLWRDRLPERPRAALHTCVWRLRRKLGENDSGLETVPSGYRLATTARDLDGFRSLVARADRAPTPECSVELLRQALDLCRGPVLPELAGGPLDDLIEGVAEEVLAVRRRRIEADLAAGLGGELVPELRALVAAHPLREEPWAHLMLALHRDGRQAEALGAYRRVSRLLADEHGLDPGERLRELHEAILVSDPRLGGPSRRIADPLAGWRVRRQLPLDLPDFVGRTGLLDELAALLESGGEARVPIVAVSGPPGIGKTALAVKLGHRLGEVLPDGQWFASLGGATDPRGAHEVAADLLQASGMPGAEIPAEPCARSAALRDRLAGRRVLLVLDDAADVDQVRPLLPGAPGSAVVVTGRGDLTGLAVSHGARMVTLGALGIDEAETLLATLAGSDAADRSDVAAAARRCGGVPLALRMAGAALAADAPPDDPVDGVRAAFDETYRALPACARTVFRLTAAAGTETISVPAIAALADVTEERAREAVEALERAGLFQRPRPGHYRLHDLLREYGRDRSREEDDPEFLASAAARMLDWYAATAHRAAGELPASNLAAPPIEPGVSEPLRFDGRDAALAWFDAEADELVALSRIAETRGHPAAWWLADAMRAYCYFGGDWRRLERIADSGERAARRRGDLQVRARMTRHLGTAAVLRGDLGAATRFDEAAVALARESGDPVEEARALIGLADDYTEHGRAAQAVALLTRALERSRSGGDEVTAANALFSLATSRRRLGHLEAAEEDLTRARDLAAVHGATHGEMVCLLELGALCQQRGDLKAARVHLESARRLAAATFYRLPELDVYSELSLVLSIGGDGRAALDAARRGHELALDNGTESASIHVAWGTALLRTGAPGEAIDHYYQALHLSTGDLARPHARARIGLAATYVSVGRAEAAAQQAARAAALASSAVLPLEQSLATTFQAWGRFTGGSLRQAAELAETAADMYAACGSAVGEALNSHLLGLVARESGRTEAAHRHWRTALALYERMAMPEAAAVRILLGGAPAPPGVSGR
ncbi:tetratricopeptide repeat protein [Glycomyces sp. TRM65418]|uniref:AfsR/SARP family transcriptional regulator n=1 Tax=Glycomyces sp. TRM65418 TaxID=2867006 RepID=UPI001CE50BF6|nr:BTAD domain-containing putative transcriptional regulator [Glycomyces sp. TRM65418]MCC3765607.1 tetratricopeptide repeat protein [Glycomyces sp. TRM65418]QZD55208.1 tetratricopeptide repeat protein [Glycomyces sp. TRM65418]